MVGIDTVRAVGIECESPLEVTVVGAAFTLAAPAVVPAILLAGYLVRAVQSGARGDPLPGFDDWAGLAVDGLVVTAVGAVAFVVPTVTLVTVVAGWGLAYGAVGVVPPAPVPASASGLGSVLAVAVPASIGGTVGVGAGSPLAANAVGGPLGAGAAGGATALAYGALGLLGTVSYTLAGYVTVVATVGYALGGSVRRAAAPDRLAAAALDVRAATLVVGAGLVAGLARVVGGVIGVVPGIGPFCGAAVALWGSLAAAVVVGRYWTTDVTAGGTHGVGRADATDS
jgi:hypothetical protein